MLFRSVFMHGGAIRDKGVSTSSLNSRLSNFVSLGFIVLAPVRNTKKGCCNGDDAIWRVLPPQTNLQNI